VLAGYTRNLSGLISNLETGGIFVKSFVLIIIIGVTYLWNSL
jgi:hypothetical protein